MNSSFYVISLGHASAIPVRDIYPTAHVLNVHGRFFLFDCGEGIQVQLNKAGVSIFKLEAILFTHFHGDHCFGLFGLLSTMSLQGRTKPLDIYGPPALAKYIELFRWQLDKELSYTIREHILEPNGKEILLDDNILTISTFPLNHTVPCVGYLVRENFTRRSRSFAYCTDTLYMPQLAQTLKGVTLLFHEATYMNSEQEKAKTYFHSTATQAATLARDCGAVKLILGHFSSRYPNLDNLLVEAKSIFPNTELSLQGSVFGVESPKKSKI